MKQLFCYIGILFFTPISGQKFFYHHFTIDDGLPVNCIYDIKESPNGLITFATDNGISFFDGIKFKNLTTKDGLDKPYIIGIQYNKRGDLYIGNYNGNFQIYKNNQFTTLPFACSTVDEVFYHNGNFISKMYISNYIGGENLLGLIYNIYNKNKELQYRYLYQKYNPKEYEYLKNDIVYRPYCINIGFESYLIDNKIHHNQHPIDIPKEIPSVFLIKKRKNDWCLFTKNHLYLVDFKSKITQKIALPFPLLTNSNRYVAEIDKNDHIWLNLQKKGLFLLENLQWKAIGSYLDLKPNQNINKLFKDSKGRMWIATHENGLYCIPNTDVLQYFASSNEDFFNSFFVYNNQLFTCNRFELYKFQNQMLEKISLPKSSEFKIGFLDNKPMFFNFNPIFHHQKIYQNIEAIQYRDYCKITENEHLFYSKQELFYEKNQEKMYILPEFTSQRFYNIEQNNNAIVVNTGNEVFAAKLKDTVIEVSKKKIKYKKLVRTKTIYTSKGFISDMKFKDDTLLLAENEALVYYKDKILKRTDAINDYKFENINKIFLFQNQIWLATIKGLLRVEKPFILNKYNYLTNNDVQDICFFQNSIYVATINGISRVPNNILQQKEEKPILQLSKYKTTNWNYIKDNIIELNSEEESVEIPLRIINYLSDKNLIVQYKIDQSDWINVDNYKINLLNLSYGNSGLTCRIKDVNSNWNEVKIEILRATPVYLQLWFLMLLIFLFLMIVYFYFNYKFKKIRLEKQKEIEINKHIVEFRQSALSAQMNPHFIFNSLNAIQYFINSNQKDKSSEYLAKLSRLVRMFLLHASETFIPLSEEIKRLQLYVNLEQLRFDNFICNFNINHIESAEQILIPNMILQPFIENAILHGVSHLQTNDGTLNIDFSRKNNELQISITDNGYGIQSKKESANHISKGLSIIEERLRIMQETHPNKTYQLHYQIPFPTENRKGHQVVIRLTIDN